MSTVAARNAAISFIQFEASNDELNMLIDAMKYRRAQLAKRNTSMVRSGSKVSFTNRAGQKLFGTVEKVMQKNVIVNTSRGNYRVPANMLAPVIDPVMA